MAKAKPAKRAFVRMSVDSRTPKVRVVVALEGVTLETSAATIDGARSRAVALARKHGADASGPALAATKALRKVGRR